MTTRVQVVVDEVEREAFRRAAAREGLSLSDWMRRAARERMASAGRVAIASAADLQAFFDECGRREQGEEPDWPAHREVIARSRRTGRSDT